MFDASLLSSPPTVRAVHRYGTSESPSGLTTTGEGTTCASLKNAFSTEVVRDVFPALTDAGAPTVPAASDTAVTLLNLLKKSRRFINALCLRLIALWILQGKSEVLTIEGDQKVIQHIAS
jgi:hypothetical protein